MAGQYRCTNPQCRARTSATYTCPSCGSRVAPDDSPASPPSSRPIRTPRSRSKAWLLYTALAAGALLAVFWQPGVGTKFTALLVAGLLGLYARYLYRGGRLVIVPVPGCLVAALALLGSVGGLGWTAWRWLG